MEFLCRFMKPVVKGEVSASVVASALHICVTNTCLFNYDALDDDGVKKVNPRVMILQKDNASGDVTGVVKCALILSVPTFLPKEGKPIAAVGYTDQSWWAGGAGFLKFKQEVVEYRSPFSELSSDSFSVAIIDPYVSVPFPSSRNALPTWSKKMSSCFDNVLELVDKFKSAQYLIIRFRGVVTEETLEKLAEKVSGYRFMGLYVDGFLPKFDIYLYFRTDQKGSGFLTTLFAFASAFKERGSRIVKQSSLISVVKEHLGFSLVVPEFRKVKNPPGNMVLYVPYYSKN